MAKEEETAQSVPALVDYEGSSEVEESRWTSRNFETYWRECIIDKWEARGVLFSLKDRTLIARCIKEFGIDSLKQMIEWWVKTNDLTKGQNVGLFFVNRHSLYEQIKPKDYSDWLD